MVHSPVVQQLFLLSSIGLVGLFAWQLLLPFLTALVLSLIVVVVSYPLYLRLLRLSPRHNQSLAAFAATLLVLLLIILPVYLLFSLLINEFLLVFAQFSTSPSSFSTGLPIVEDLLQNYIPWADVNIATQLQQSAQWLTRNLGGVFTSTISLVIGTLVAVLGMFYLFRDGERLKTWLVDVSPLPNDQDQLVIDRIAIAIRSVAMGTLFISIIQGVVATIGFTIFGIERAILWGAVGAFGALLPGIGLAGIMVPAVAFLFFTGQTTMAVGLLVYAVLAIAIVDNLIAPYLLSRGSNLHPFIILLSVLGGLTVFGPIGFILGPIVISLFLTLIDLYANVEIRSSIKKKRTAKSK